jgi:D-alanyl-D-alanine carboxypeptidase
LAALLLYAQLSLPAAAAAPDNSAVSAILMDGESGRVLYEKNADEKRQIASITKLMTALVAVESTPHLTDLVTIKPEWTRAEGTSMYLKAGEQVSLETLLYGLLLVSGNDAALAVAGYCAGDVDTFVDWMNQRAATLGMENTHFANPNGLNDDGHCSTAADMAKLALECMKNETIAKIVSTKSINIGTRTFTNHNKLLWQYEGCVGMKTGYTELAG